MRFAFISGFEERYRVSDTGIVQSCCSRIGPRRRVEWWDMTLTETRRNPGYLTVNLWDSTAKRNLPVLVHQLVARAFVAAVDGKPCVNHLDGDKKNNHAGNLEWCTRAENMRHAWGIGLCKPHKLTPEQVREIRSCGGLDTAVAKRFGVSQVLVTKIRARALWKSVA